MDIMPVEIFHFLTDEIKFSDVVDNLTSHVLDLLKFSYLLLTCPC